MSERNVNPGTCVRCGRPAESATPETGWHEITDDSDTWSEGRTVAVICPDCLARPALAVEREPLDLGIKHEDGDLLAG